MQRILVIGPGGAGKSTLARQIAARLDLPLIHLDALFWHPGWVKTPEPEWRERVAELVAGERWVMDGNYGGTLEQRLVAADAVIFLDFPRWLCLARVVRRRLRHAGRTRPEMAPGCPERLTREFLWWIWTYPRRRRGDVLQRLSALPADREVIILRSPKQVDHYIGSFAQHH